MTGLAPVIHVVLFSLGVEKPGVDPRIESGGDGFGKYAVSFGACRESDNGGKPRYFIQ